MEVIKLAVLGATGFLGINLVKRLKEEGYDFIALIRRTSNTRLLDELNISYDYCNFNNVSDIKSKLDNISIIIHLAAITPNKKEPNLKDANITFTKNIISSINKTKIKKIIYISSANVLDNIQDDYELSKKECEKLVIESSLNYVILRPSLIYGQYDDKNLTTILQIIKNFPIIPIGGNGKYKIQPVYVEDVVSAIIFSLNQKISNKTYVVAGPEPIEFNKVIDIISSVLNKRRLKLHIPISITYILLKFYNFFSSKTLPIKSKKVIESKKYDISATKIDLNYNPISFHEGIKIWVQKEKKLLY